MSIALVIASNHLVLCPPLFLPPSIFPSIRIFSNESVLCIRCHSIGISALASVLPVNIRSWFPLKLTGLISFESKGLYKESFPAPQFESISSLAVNLLYGLTLTSIHDYWKSHSFDSTDLCRKVMSLLFNTLSRFVIAFLLRSKPLLISWLQSLSTVIFGAQ